MHGAEGWEELLLPENERQQKQGKEVVFRADPAFSKPERGQSCCSGAIRGDKCQRRGRWGWEINHRSCRKGQDELRRPPQRGGAGLSLARQGRWDRILGESEVANGNSGSDVLKMHTLS